MPTKEIDVAIKELERQVEYYENLLDKSISNNEILLKVKFIYHQLKDVSQKLHASPILSDSYLYCSHYIG